MRSFLGSSDSKASACNAGDPSSIPGLERFHWRRKWQPTPVPLPGKSHGQRSMVGYSPWGRKNLDTTEWLHLSLIIKGIHWGSYQKVGCIKHIEGLHVLHIMENWRAHPQRGTEENGGRVFQKGGDEGTMSVIGMIIYVIIRITSSLLSQDLKVLPWMLIIL